VIGRSCVAVSPSAKYSDTPVPVYLADGLTATQERPMTLAYGSPEQLRGEEITFATDLHALGLVFYELLTGHHPYSDSACQRLSGDEQPAPLFDRVCSRLPRLPSQVVRHDSWPIDDGTSPTSGQSIAQLASDRGTQTRELSRTLREDYDVILMRCLAKRPSDRFGSAVELRDALQFARLRHREGAVEVGWRGFVRASPLLASTLLALFAAILGAIATSFAVRNEKVERLVAEPTAAPRGDELPELPWSEWVTELLDSRSEQDTLANHRETLLVFPPETRAALAARAADKQQNSLTRFLVQTFAPESATYPSSDQHRWGLAQAAADARLPTIAARALHDELNMTLKKEDPDWWALIQSTPKPMDAAETLIRVLLELELHAAAFECSDIPELRDRNDTEFLLLAAEARTSIGWREGATELLAALGSRVDDLTEEQQRRFRFWTARAADPEERLRRLQEWIDAGDADQWEEALLQTSALLAAAKVELELDDAQTAGALLDRARALVRRVGGYGTAVAARVDREACQLALDLSEIDKARTMLAETWTELATNGELASSAAVYVTLRNVDFLEPQDGKTALARLRAHEFIHELFPYNFRELLLARGDAASQRADWAKAAFAFSRLVKLETELWSADSYNIVRAKALLVTALQAQGRDEEAKPYETDVRRFAKSLYAEVETLPARGFLLPVLEGVADEDSYPLEVWLEKFEHQRNNSVPIQEQMIRYEIEQLRARSPETADLLRTVLDD
ncbi:MAG: hypothetical protein AAFU85_07170, partial [Planctomycetota bacterium]